MKHCIPLFRRWSGLFLAATLIVVSSHAAVTAQDLEVVVTASGSVRGLVTDHREFRGIPFAAAPVGDLRWRVPEPVPAWTDVRDATTFGNSCPQPGLRGAGSTNEDCLFLNVYTPLQAENLPVMVWIHGGAFTMGTASTYDGTALALNGDVVVVTVNYRLGILGFLATPALAAENPDGRVGNYGLLDQQLALRWVRDNIARFGGDPDNVTIFGESAGGASVCLHQISPASAGLFHKAINQSGPCDTLTAAREASFQVGEGVTTAVQCDNSDPAAEMACMRALPVDSILTAQSGLSIMTATADGVTVPGEPSEVFAAGDFNAVPTIQGFNAQEGRLFVYLSIFTESLAPSGAYDAALEAMFGEYSDDVLEAYPLVDGDAPREAYAAIIGDSGFNCPGRSVIRHIAAHDVPVYAYEFTDPHPPLPLGLLGPTHGTEIVYVFQTPMFGKATGLSGGQLALSDQMQAYWTNFARTGDPNGADLPEWTAYSEADDNYLELTSVPPGPHATSAVSAKHQCAFWEALPEASLQ